MRDGSKKFRWLLANDGNTKRLFIFAILLFLFFFLELVFAVITGSVSLLSDAFHMISDFSSTILAIYAIVVSHRPDSDSYTYGLSRAQVLGGLVNGVFLLTVCFMMAIEVAMKLTHLDELKELEGHGLEITYVGAAGLLVNVLGMVMLGGHGHSHAGSGHGHAHGGGAHHEDAGEGESLHDCDHGPKEKQHEHGDLNMHAAWLHAMGDMLGSVVVVAVGIIIEFAEGDWKYYADPALTAIILAIIAYAAIPLVRNCSVILVQGAPPGIDVSKIASEVFESSGDIVDVHDVHLWELEPGNCVGSLHVVFGRSFDRSSFQVVATVLKGIMHRHGVHSVAIQPEFSNHDCADFTSMSPDFCGDELSCLLACEPGCEQASVCCDDRQKTKRHLHKRRTAQNKIGLERTLI